MLEVTNATLEFREAPFPVLLLVALVAICDSELNMDSAVSVSLSVRFVAKRVLEKQAVWTDINIQRGI